ncbi:MAG: DEAD/DEAH box helicase, partial [Fretibacterium sp.]|nr:DEAD/DEAH box helicase [Fretibacterium sp.]
MLFDEAERERLLALYAGLPDGLRQACRLLAVVRVPAGPTHLVQCLSRAGVPRPNGSPWRQSQFKELLAALPGGFIASRPVGQRVQYQLSPLLTGPLWREARECGEFDRFDSAAESELKVSARVTSERLPSLEDAYSRQIRLAAMRGEVQTFRRLWLGVMSSRAGPDPSAAVLDALANPLEPELLFHLPPGLAEYIFTILLFVALPHAGIYRKVAQALFDYPRGDITPGLELIRIERLIAHGRLDDAEERLRAFNDPQGFSLSAVLALSRRGDEAEALALYEEGLKRMKADVKKGWGAAFYTSWTGLFYPVLLFKSGAGERRVKAYLKEPANWGTVEDLSCLRPLLGQLPGVRGEKSPHFHPAPPNHPLTHPSLASNGLAVFPALLLLRWRDADLGDVDVPALVELLRERGLDFLSAELEAAFGLGGEQGPTHPLAAVFTRKEEWEQSLDELLNIGGRPPAKGSPKRVIWEVDWYCGRENRIRALTLTPVEQTLKRDGWSKGRGISLQRLYRNGHSVPGITEQDLRALPAIRATRNYYGTEYSLDPYRALSLLAGHPLLFRRGTGEQVEVLSEAPLLLVQEQRRGYVLTLSPFPGGDERCVVTLEGPRRLRVTQFGERHLRIAHILGPSGLLIPALAKDRLLRTLESLASAVTIQSDLEGPGGSAEAIPPDARVYVRLQPNGGGLDVEVVSRPLGAGGPICHPGRGGTALFGVLDKRRVRTSRDLDAESAALSALLEACPALAEGEQVREEGWRVPGPRLALELLTQLIALGGSVVVEWPQGQSLKISPPVGVRGLSVSIRRSRDWFAVSGELRVREGLVLTMKELLEAMKAGMGRFVPLGNGEFLTLTREFQQRLEGLASLGGVRGGEVRLAPLAAGVAGELLEGAAQEDVAEEWRSRIALVEEAERMMPELPSTFRGELRDYQLEGFRWLMRLAHWGAGACLADDMGLGKTVQTLAVLAARGREGPSLVVAPTSVCPNWVAEASRFAPALRVKDLRGEAGHAGRGEILAHLEPMDVVVVSYGILQNEGENLARVPWNVIVLDEAQAIKNMGTKRSSAVMKLNGSFRIATTGTPIENSLSELWNLFRFLTPGYLGPFEGFWRRFGAPIERGGADGRTCTLPQGRTASGRPAPPERACQPMEGLGATTPDRRSGLSARQRLRQVIRPFVLRRTKEQVLSELPPKTEITLKVELKPEERAFYEALRRSAVEELSAVREEGEEGRLQVLAALMKLRRACCSASLVNAELHLPSAKLEAFAGVLEKLRGGRHKSLVFSQFTGHLALLRAWLEGEGIAYQYLDGSTPQEERERRVAAFQAGAGDCFLISLRAGGTGLNLTAADYVLHMDPWWNPAV